MKLLKNFFTVNKKLILQKNNFILFLILTFVFITSTALVMSKSGFQTKQFTNLIIKESKTFPSIPILNESSSYPLLSAQGVFAVDLGSGISLYEKNADAPLLPASTTKILTALVALDSYNLDGVITVGKRSIVEGQKMGLYPGEQIKVIDVLYGLLVYSANDAAEALAENYEGGYDGFITAMNTKAKELSLSNSHFENPTGFDGNGQRSTARDLVRASEVAMRNPIFAKIVNTKQITVTDLQGNISYNLKNINELLGNVPGVMGVKTGWTESARENLVTYIDRDGHRIMIAILGSIDRFGETRELIDWIFNNYEWQEVRTP